jgi:tetratricopeptide (TPR) repeat protein
MWEALSYSNLSTIARLFREAIDLDPHNARAFAGLAHALITDGLWERLGVSGRYAFAQAAVEKALELDPELPEAKCAAAWLKIVSERDWEGARRGFDEVLMLHPPTSRAMVGRAMLHISEGFLQEASSLFLQDAQHHPLSSSATTWYCWNNYLAGEYAQALDEIEQMRASGQTGPISNAVEALALIQLEEPGACIPRLEVLTVDSPHNDVLRGALGYVYAVTGQGQRASELLDVLANPGKWGKIHEPYAIALVLIGLNQRQEAVQRLEQSYREGSLWSLGFLSDPILAPLRNDPHYRLFLSKVSYPVQL